MLGIMPLVVIAVLDGTHHPDDLSHAVAEVAPGYLTPEKALPHVRAALAAQTEQVPAELLLSLVYSESRYDPGATSYLIDGKRRAHAPKWAWAKKPPKGVSGPYFCGVTQVAAKRSWKRCLEMRNIEVAYKVAVREITSWLKACKKHKNKMRCALFGYGGGYPAIKRGTSTYPSRVLTRARRILNKTLKARDRRWIEVYGAT